MGDRSAVRPLFTQDDKTTKEKEGRQCTYEVILLCFRVTTVATEMQECFPLYCCRTYVFVNNVMNIESVVMEA
jgi:hypothetical protein